MDKEERLEVMKAVWGPPPSDPVARSIWEHGMDLLAELPDVIAQVVEHEGTDHPTLAQVFGNFLSALEEEVVWRFLQVRLLENMRDAVRDVLKGELWQAMLHGRSPVQRTRIAERLAEDVAANLGRIILGNPVYRGWLVDP